MLYLLDANVLITAHNNYYPVNRVPEFWDWLLHQAEEGYVKMPVEMFYEITAGTGDADKDLLLGWLKDGRVQDALVLKEDVRIVDVQKVVTQGYAPDLGDTEIEQIGNDPFLVAYALLDLANRCVVSNEVSAPSKRRANRKIPDVCRALGAKSCNTFALLKALDFSTGWRS